MFNRAVLLVTLLVAFSGPIFAQRLNQQPVDPAFGAANSGQIPSTITGSVSALDNRPLPDARVEVRDLNSGATVGSTFTHANGSFALYNIVPGDYEVVAISGINESRERVHVITGDATVNLRINAPVNDSSSGSTVSVAQFKVPGNARKEYDRAYKAFSDSKFDEAKKKVNKALEIYENFAEALTLRGILAVNDGNYEGGEADLQKAIRTDPNYAMAYFAMGAALNQTAKYDDALRSLQRGVAIAPDGWQGHFEMAKAFLGKADFKSALKSVVRAQAHANNQYPPLHLVKAHALLGVQQYDAAIIELEQFLSREPNGGNSQKARETLARAKAFLVRHSSPSDSNAFKAGGR